jgi:Zn-dependent protease with chaperone function
MTTVDAVQSPRTSPVQAFIETVRVAVERQPWACVAGLLSGWTALWLAVWFAAFFAVGGAIAGLTGATFATQSIGQAGQAFDIVAALAGFGAGLVFGFALIFGASLALVPVHVLLSLVVGAIFAFGITWLALELESTSLDLRSYRRPSHRADEAKVVALLADVARRLGLASVPDLRIADQPLPGAWTHARTIVVTRGLITQMDGKEIAAVLAHELHHWQSGDPVAMRVVWACAFPVILANNLRVIVSRFHPWGPLVNVFLWPALVLVRWVIAPVMVTRGRRLEFEADAAAIAAGYGSALARALTKMGNFETARTGWEAAIMRTHPPIEFRLEAIEEASATSA